jgi:hypothetical protein
LLRGEGGAWPLVLFVRIFLLWFSRPGTWVDVEGRKKVRISPSWSLPPSPERSHPAHAGTDAETPRREVTRPRSHKAERTGQGSLSVLWK